MSVYNSSGTAGSNTTIGGVASTGSSNPNLIDNILQQLAAQDRNLLNDLGGNNTVGGTADAITITPSSGSISAAFEGLIIGFIAGTDNATTTPTANVGGLGAEPIKKAVAGVETAVAIGDIQAGGFYLLRWRASWDSSGGAWELVNITGQPRDVGQIAAFAMNSAPAGWLECDGSAVSRTTYSTLFARISTTFGEGDGSTTFDLPDLRGEFVRGWDNSRGVDADRVFGSAQSGTSVPNVSVNSSNVLLAPKDTAVSGADSTSAGSITRTIISGSESATTTRYYTTRPRNIALLYCIRY